MVIGCVTRAKLGPVVNENIKIYLRLDSEGNRRGLNWSSMARLHRGRIRGGYFVS